MKIDDRQKVFEKYGGRCAYCGRKIEYKDMQVDHMTPQIAYKDGKAEGNKDEIANLMPACRRCNHYKRSNTLESFREMISKIPFKLARDSYIYRVGMAYGFYDDKSREIKFYFERCEKPESEG